MADTSGILAWTLVSECQIFGDVHEPAQGIEDYAARTSDLFARVYLLFITGRHIQVQDARWNDKLL